MVTRNTTYQQFQFWCYSISFRDNWGNSFWLYQYLPQVLVFFRKKTAAGPPFNAIFRRCNKLLVCRVTSHHISPPPPFPILYDLFIFL